MWGPEHQHSACFWSPDRLSDVVTRIGINVTTELVMKANVAVTATVVAASAFSLAELTRAQTHAGLDTAAIEQGTGLKGQLIAEESVFKVTKPRTDVKIQVDQWTMPPFMGLSTWPAFTPAHIDD